MSQLPQRQQKKKKKKKKIRWSFRKRNKIAVATENKYEFFEVNPTF